MKKKYPEHNVEYYIEIPRKDGTSSKNVFIFQEELPNGRLRLLNKTYGNYLTMLPDRFSYLYRFNRFDKDKKVEEPVNSLSSALPHFDSERKVIQWLLLQMYKVPSVKKPIYKELMLEPFEKGIERLKLAVTTGVYNEMDIKYIFAFFNRAGITLTA